jgi:rhodanese-related sulfurtransferase
MHNPEKLLVKEQINGQELEHLLSERKKKRADFLLIDVREGYEYNEKK